MQQAEQAYTGDLASALRSVGCRLVDRHATDVAVRRWNGALNSRPLLVAACGNAEQVAAALRLVRAADQSVTIHSGGQDWTGRSLRDGSVVLDLSDMDAIAIDVNRREATIGGGATTGRLNAATAERGLAAVIGNDGAVGVAGLLMGGGYGPLMTRLGLACDSLLSADVVLPDGRFLQCDAAREPNLFWALRGGGGNFGVVTAVRLRLHDLRTVLVGTLVFPWSQARVALLAYAALMERAPADLFGSIALAGGPGNVPVAVVTLVWSGTVEQGEAIVSDLAAAGRPTVARTEVLPAAALLSLTDGKLAQGRGYEVGTRWFSNLSRDAVDALVTGFDGRTSAMTSVIVHHCHGAATAIAADATAFGQREPHFTALVYAAWEPASADAAAHRAWTAGLMAQLARSASRGGYANLLPDKAGEQVAHAYGPNAARLASLKRRYDPGWALRASPLPLG